jgi:L-threonylcarbamoyladenylate synthase
VSARILPPTDESIRLAADEIKSGKVVGMPTETVYGLAGAAFDEAALTRIFNTKERPTFDPLIVHVAPSDSAAISPLAELERLHLIDTSSLKKPALEICNQLFAAFWPGPLTLVLPKHAKVPDLATSGMKTVALRMPKHPVAQALIRAAGTPLAAPSANRFGRISPTSAQDVQSELGDRIELILDGGSCEVGLESTVLAVSPDGELTLLRPGGISQGKIEETTGQKLRLTPSRASHGAASPGMLESHYAPRKPLYLMTPEGALPEDLPAALPETLGLLTFSSACDAEARLSRLTSKKVIARSVTETGDLEEAARNLFRVLRELDGSRAGLLLTEPSPSQEGLGYAIADRLKRASHR